jgi:hypothetical protein
MKTWPDSIACWVWVPFQRQGVSGTSALLSKARNVFDGVGSLSVIYDADVHPVKPHQRFDLLREPLVDLIYIQRRRQDLSDARE